MTLSNALLRQVSEFSARYGGDLKCFNEEFQVEVPKSSALPLVAKGSKKNPIKSDVAALKLMVVLSGKGLSKKKIGVTFGVSEAFVNKCFVANGLGNTSDKAKGQLRARRLSRADRLHVRNSYRLGQENLTSLAKKFGFKSTGPIRRILRESRILTRKEIQFTSMELKSIICDYRSGIGISGIARKFEVDASVIHKRLVDQGISIRGTDMASQARSVYEWRGKSDGEKESFARFKADARRLTQYVYTEFSYLINPEGLKRGKGSDDYVLDHCHSIWEAGFNPKGLKRPINIWELCHPANLELLKFSDNAKKNKTSSMTSAQLRRKIRDWNKTFIEPYFQMNDDKIKIFKESYGLFETYGELGCQDVRGYYKTTYGL